MNRWVLPIALTMSACFGQAKPQNVALSTWVREDLFAGILANDMDRFENGVKKLDAYQAQHAQSGEARAWRAFSDMVRAVKALEAGRRADFERRYLAARKDFDEIDDPSGGAVFAIAGGTFALMAERVPEEFRHDANQRVYKNYSALKQGQAAVFDQLPVHMRGEVLGGLAQASGRLGRTEESRTIIAEIIKTLPGTPYESRAKKWVDNPELAKTLSLTCQTCHEPGRLQNRLAGATH